MQKRCIAGLLIFGLMLSKGLYGQDNAAARIVHFTSSHTSFPDSARAKGHLYDSVLYSTAEHYLDSSVLMVIPPNLDARKKIDLVFWFHGWHNNIDTAVEFYALTRQFAASNRNAILVLAEAAKNAPDSYGGKLEKPGTFKGLVDDVMKKLKDEKIVTARAKPGNIVLAGHSGAYRVIAYMLQNGQVPVNEVFLFDALYSEVDKFMYWEQLDRTHHFVHWFTNHGGGTDEMSDTMMRQLKEQNIPYTLTEESAVTPEIIKTSRIIFIHSPREHNVIINNPDDFKMLLENSHCLKKSR